MEKARGWTVEAITGLAEQAAPLQAGDGTSGLHVTEQCSEWAGREGGDFKLTLQRQNYDHHNRSGMCAESNDEDAERYLVAK